MPVAENELLAGIAGYDRVLVGLNENIRGLKAHARILDEVKDGYTFPLFEKAMYVAISASDLCIALKYLDVSHAMKNGYETNFFARTVGLLSYELVQHQQKIVGLEVSTTIQQRLGVEQLSEFRQYTKTLGQIGKTYGAKLGEIRNKMLGHRTERGAEMADKMLALESLEIYRVGDEVFKAYLGLLDLYVKLIEQV